MKASEMTNEELAKELTSRVPLDSNRHDDIREAVREVAQEMLNTSMQDITAERINGWATRLAAACEQSVTDCNQLNNAAAMREALVQCELFLGNVSRHGHPTLNPGDKCTACDGVDELREMVASALSAPPRNCDRFATFDDARNTFFAYYMLDETRSSASAFAIWLFDKAKGDTE